MIKVNLFWKSVYVLNIEIFTTKLDKYGTYPKIYADRALIKFQSGRADR